MIPPAGGWRYGTTGNFVTSTPTLQPSVSGVRLRFRTQIVERNRNLRSVQPMLYENALHSRGQRVDRDMQT